MDDIRASDHGPVLILFMNIRQPSDKNAISRVFGIHYKVLASWLHSLGYLRNLCAHHSRLWNRTFTIKPIVLEHHPIADKAQSRFAAQAAILVDMLQATAPNSKWPTRLYETFLQHPDVDAKRMGFPNDWQSDNFWHVSAPRWRALWASAKNLMF